MSSKKTDDRKKTFHSFFDFYPFYLEAHSDKRCRILHFAGCFFVLFLLVLFFVTMNKFLLLLCPLVGYGFAFLGHLLFEKNKPLSFKYPFYSFLSDWLMFLEAIFGKFIYSNHFKKD